MIVTAQDKDGKNKKLVYRGGGSPILKEGDEMFETVFNRFVNEKRAHEKFEIAEILPEKDIQEKDFPKRRTYLMIKNENNTDDSQIEFSVKS